MASAVSLSVVSDAKVHMEALFAIDVTATEAAVVAICFSSVWGCFQSNGLGSLRKVRDASEDALES